MSNIPGPSASTIDHYCEVMHDAYELAATKTGWETQAASRKPWSDVPESNKATMREAVSALLEALEERDLQSYDCMYAKALKLERENDLLTARLEHPEKPSIAPEDMQDGKRYAVTIEGIAKDGRLTYATQSLREFALLDSVDLALATRIEEIGGEQR